MAADPCVDAAHAYARDVVAGRIPAGRWIRLACQRHLDDLARQDDPAFPYRFDARKAAKVCKFLQLLPHTKGKWARKAERLRLEPWQLFKTAALFGWLRKADGLRRYRKAFLLIPRKNAKSTWAAGIGLYLFAADGEYGAEVYSGATSEKQAWEVFRPAKLMAQKTPALLQAFGIHVGAKNLHILANGSRFEPMIGTPGDGASPSAAIHDEYHEHPTDEQVDTMETGMGAREQPLLVIITTAGDNLAGPCFALQQEAQKVLEGALYDPELFALIYTVDPEDDWTSELALRKANPNFDVSVSGEYLLTRQRAARAVARQSG
ncbi:terminase large subunit, partial [Methylobacterium isbiliense]|uniref:terminase large subunit n=1 Tax=Methylobacterium isbiliense TaxID=315478 RepID=UPI001EE20CA1